MEKVAFKQFSVYIEDVNFVFLVVLYFKLLTFALKEVRDDSFLISALDFGELSNNFVVCFDLKRRRSCGMLNSNFKCFAEDKHEKDISSKVHKDSSDYQCK